MNSADAVCFIYLLIFGYLLPLAAASLWFSKDPWEFVFFAKLQG